MICLYLNLNTSYLFFAYTFLHFPRYLWLPEKKRSAPIEFAGRRRRHVRGRLARFCGGSTLEQCQRAGAQEDDPPCALSYVPGLAPAIASARDRPGDHLP